LRVAVGPQPSGWGVWDSNFSETNQNLSKFYACAAVFSAAFLAAKKRQTKL